MSTMDGRKSQSVKYQQIADDIRLKILGGIYARNEMLPSEKKLGEKYGASRLTIRNTLNLLENEGYIYTKAGKGSFVKGVSTDLYRIDMDINSILNGGYDRVELIKAKMIKPDIDLVYELKVSRESKIVFMDWHIFRDELIIGYDRRFIPYFRGLPIDEKDLTYTGLKDMIKGSQTDFREEIVINGIIPEAWLKEKMDIDSKNTDSVLLVERKIYDDRGTPTGLDRLYLNADESCIKGVFNV